MFYKLKRKIENKRNSKSIFDRFLVFIKDFIFYKIYCNLYKFKNKIIFYCKINSISFSKRNEIKKIIKDISEGNSSKKIDLMDATFIIPTSLDSNDRKENLDYVIKYIESFFNTNIIVGEEGEKRNFEYVSNNAGYVFLLNKNGLFHKTKILNNLIKLANTKIIISYDADVLANPLHIFYSVLLLRKNKADVVYPYNGDVVDADKKQKEKIFSKMNIFLHNKKYHYDRSRCFGGVCIANKDTFIDIGMENENFISWGVEDEERNIRFEKFSYRINRTPSVLIHLYHTRTINSTNNHSNYKSNSTEYEKINLMNREELKQYVKSWPWLKNVK